MYDQQKNLPGELGRGRRLVALGALPRQGALPPIRSSSARSSTPSGAFDAYGKPMDMAPRPRRRRDQCGRRPARPAGRDRCLRHAVRHGALYRSTASKLARSDKVDVVHGGILSASREAIRQTLRKAGVPYFYNVLYEGGVCDRNITVIGVTPSQQVEVLIPAAIKKWGKKIYVAGCRLQLRPDHRALDREVRARTPAARSSRPTSSRSTSRISGRPSPRSRARPGYRRACSRRRRLICLSSANGRPPA